ncbi:MAG: phage minor head protein [Rhizomicrobium sp.]
MALIEARDITPEDALAALTRRLANPVQSFSWQDIEREMHARSFTVAKSAGYDILDDIGEAMHKAVAGGETVESFKKKLTPILQDAGWWGRSEEVDPLTGETVDVQLGSARRLETIFDTNMRTSYAAGRYLSIERNKQSQPYMRYVAVQDDRTRPLHRAWDGTTLPVDDPW